MLPVLREPSGWHCPDVVGRPLTLRVLHLLLDHYPHLNSQRFRCFFRIIGLLFEIIDLFSKIIGLLFEIIGLFSKITNLFAKKIDLFSKIINLFFSSNT